MYRRTISADPMDLAAKSKFIATEIVRDDCGNDCGAPHSSTTRASQHGAHSPTHGEKMGLFDSSRKRDIYPPTRQFEHYQQATTRHYVPK